ncbi:hypothetical protein [Pedobacter sp.]|uniref:hypothetical protein n=1 Tax=Pedobacter sp. TaxID=1411316 RepID=UPI00396CC515
MGEYVRYRGKDVKIGTCECLYYVSYDKYLTYARERYGTSDLEYIPFYLQIEQGFMFRFPFPDEDRLPFGRIIEPHDRTVDITIDKAVRDKLFGEGDMKSQFKIGIIMQKPVIRRSDGQFCVALIFNDNITGGLYRLEETHEAKLVAGQIVRHHILNETNQEKKNFYRQIAFRMLKGYREGQSLAQLRAKQNEMYGSGNSEVEKMDDRHHIEKQKEKNKTPDDLGEPSRKKGKRMGR